MKLSKRLLALAAAMCMTVPMFTACGDTNAGGNAEEGGAGAAGTVAEGEASIVIGGIGPLTGATAVYGNAVKNAAQLAVDEINEAGGVNGIKFVLDFQDDENNEEKAVNAYNTLKDHDVKALVATVTSAPCIAVGAESAKDNIFQITPSGSAIDCTAGENAFRVCFTDPGQGQTAAKYIKEQGLSQKVAVIYDSSDVYSTGIYEGFTAEAAAQGIEIVAAEAFTADSKTDFSVQIQKVQESGADLLFLPIYYQEAALILTQADKVGLDIQIFGSDGFDGIIDQLGGDVALAQDVMLMTPFSASSTEEKSAAFTSAYKAKYNDEVPNQFAADAYDAVYIIKACMEHASITDASISASDFCDALKTAMTEITYDGVTGSTTWTADGEPTKAAKVVKINVENGTGSYVEI